MQHHGLYAGSRTLVDAHEVAFVSGAASTLKLPSELNDNSFARESLHYYSSWHIERGIRDLEQTERRTDHRVKVLYKMCKEYIALYKRNVILYACACMPCRFQRSNAVHRINNRETLRPSQMMQILRMYKWISPSICPARYPPFHCQQPMHLSEPELPWRVS